MDINKNYIKKKIYIDSRKSSPYNVLSGNTWYNLTKEAFYEIPILLDRTYEITEFVDVERDMKIQKIERQEINPFFIEFDFFSTVSAIKINKGSVLTPKMIDYVYDKIGAGDLLNFGPIDAFSSGATIQEWFDQIGVNIFPLQIDKATRDNELDKLDKFDNSYMHIVSKANTIPITINK